MFLRQNSLFLFPLFISLDVTFLLMNKCQRNKNPTHTWQRHTERLYCTIMWHIRGDTVRDAPYCQLDVTDASLGRGRCVNLGQERWDVGITSWRASLTCNDSSSKVDVDDAGGEGGQNHSQRGKEAAHHHHWTAAEAVHQHAAHRTWMKSNTPR